MIHPENQRQWANDNVEHLKPVTAAAKARKHDRYLERDSFVVRGIPVGARDHSVNEVIFGHDENLLIAVVRLTNAPNPISLTTQGAKGVTRVLIPTVQDLSLIHI